MGIFVLPTACKREKKYDFYNNIVSRFIYIVSKLVFYAQSTGTVISGQFIYLYVCA